jgi:hypothetical protein
MAPEINPNVKRFSSWRAPRAVGVEFDGRMPSRRRFRVTQTNDSLKTEPKSSF